MPALTVVGAINLDLTARVARAPRAGETVADGVLAREPGGKGANQAVAAARLGADVRLVGAVGTDAEGDAMLAGLRAAGVDVAGVQRVGAATGTALITVDGEGENAIVVCPGANAAVDPAGVTVPGDLLAQLEVADAVVEAAIAAASGFVALNVAPARRLADAAWERVDLFIANEGEYAALPELASAPFVALTLGAEGAVLLREGREIARAVPPPTTVVSTVGAGDAFCAALVVGLRRGDPEQAALARACAVGAAAVADARSQPALHPLDAYPAPAPA